MFIFERKQPILSVRFIICLISPKNSPPIDNLKSLICAESLLVSYDTSIMEEELTKGMMEDIQRNWSASAGERGRGSIATTPPPSLPWGSHDGPHPNMQLKNWFTRHHSLGWSLGRYGGNDMVQNVSLIRPNIFKNQARLSFRGILYVECSNIPVYLIDLHKCEFFRPSSTIFNLGSGASYLCTTAVARFGFQYKRDDARLKRWRHIDPHDRREQRSRRG